MIDNAGILANIQSVFDENGAQITLTRTARDETTTSQTVIGFRKRVISSASSDLRSNAGVDLGDSEVILEASANPKAGDVLDLFGQDHVIRPPVIQINPLGTLFAWSVIARPLS